MADALFCIVCIFCADNALTKGTAGIFMFAHRSIINLQKDDDVWDICHLKKNVCLVVDFLWVE
jgi:hypothetical protein